MGCRKLTYNEGEEITPFLGVWKGEALEKPSFYFQGYLAKKGTGLKKRDSLYPFGLPMDNNSFLESGASANRFLYQGKEWQTELGLNLYDFHARQFDPALGRFLAVDAASQFSSPYLGMGNMPVMGVDPDGEWFGIDDLIAGVVGGVVNVVVQAVQGNLNGGFFKAVGKGFAAFGAGAVAGTTALYGPAGWVVGGSVLGATNSALGGGSWSQIGQGALFGGVTGLVGGGIGKAIAPGLQGVLGNIKSPALRGLLGGTLGGGIAGGALGGASSALSGGSFWDGAGQGALNGAITGGLAGGASAAARARAFGRNPWTGDLLKPTPQKISPSTARPPRSLANPKKLTPNEIGEIGEADLRAQGFVKRRFDAGFLGRRDVDGFKYDPEFGNIVAESKTGYASNTKFIQRQAAKDLYLLDQGIVKRVEWHFYKSPVTGKIGPSLPLLQRLSTKGIHIVIHDSH